MHYGWKQRMFSPPFKWEGQGKYDCVRDGVQASQVIHLLKEWNIPFYYFNYDWNMLSCLKVSREKSCDLMKDFTSLCTTTVSKAPLFGKKRH